MVLVAKSSMTSLPWLWPHVTLQIYATHSFFVRSASLTETSHSPPVAEVNITVIGQSLRRSGAWPRFTKGCELAITLKFSQYTICHWATIDNKFKFGTLCETGPWTPGMSALSVSRLFEGLVFFFFQTTCTNTCATRQFIELPASHFAPRVNHFLARTLWEKLFLCVKVVDPISDILKHHKILQGWKIYCYDDCIWNLIVVGCKIFK